MMAPPKSAVRNSHLEALRNDMTLVNGSIMTAEEVRAQYGAQAHDSDQ